MSNYFDSYTIQARVAPIFIVIFPLIIIFATIAPKALAFQTIAGSTIVSMAFSFLGAQFSRDLGKTKELKLWQDWGGAPTTQILRHRNIEYNSIRRDLIYNKLQPMIPEVVLPSPEFEKENPEKADQIYETFVRHLIIKTRDKKEYPLVFKENVNYGFLRNLWGLKAYGITISLIGIIISSVYAGFEWLTYKSVLTDFLIVFMLSSCYLLMWIFWMKPKRIKVAAFAYAERLFECCE